MDNCIFCKIGKGEIPPLGNGKFWEDEKYMAFLSPYPNTEGFSIVIPKEHRPSYVFDNLEEEINGLMKAAKKVAKILDNAFDDVGRTGVIFEGFGVDHLHLKLFPMHGTKMKNWKAISSNIDKYFEKYEGYMSSHDYRKGDITKIAELAKKIRNSE